MGVKKSTVRIRARPSGSAITAASSPVAGDTSTSGGYSVGVSWPRTWARSLGASLHAQPEPWLNRGSRTSSRIVSAMGRRYALVRNCRVAEGMCGAGSARDTETAEAVPAEGEVGQTGQGVDHEMGHDQGPGPPPPQVDEAEDRPEQQISGKASPSLIQVIRPPEDGARCHRRGSSPADLLEPADQIADHHGFLEQGVLCGREQKDGDGPPE